MPGKLSVRSCFIQRAAENHVDNLLRLAIGMAGRADAETAATPSAYSPYQPKKLGRVAVWSAAASIVRVKRRARDLYSAQPSTTMVGVDWRGYGTTADVEPFFSWPWGADRWRQTEKCRDVLNTTLKTGADVVVLDPIRAFLNGPIFDPDYQEYRLMECLDQFARTVGAKVLGFTTGDSVFDL